MRNRGSKLPYRHFSVLHIADERHRGKFVLLLFGWPTARPLLRRHGSDDQLSAALVGHRDLGAVERHIDQTQHLRIVEHFGVWLARFVEPDVADDITAPPQMFAGIRQFCALQKTKGYAARRKHDRENRLRWPLGGSEADHKPVVIVIHKLDRAGYELTHFGEATTRKSFNFWIVFCEEGIELPLGIGLRSLTLLAAERFWVSHRALLS